MRQRGGGGGCGASRPSLVALLVPSSRSSPSRSSRTRTRALSNQEPTGEEWPLTRVRDRRRRTRAHHRGHRPSTAPASSTPPRSRPATDSSSAAAGTTPSAASTSRSARSPTTRRRSRARASAACRAAASRTVEEGTIQYAPSNWINDDWAWKLFGARSYDDREAGTFTAYLEVPDGADDHVDCRGGRLRHLHPQRPHRRERPRAGPLHPGRLRRMTSAADAVVARLRAAGCVFAEDEAALLLEAAGGCGELESMVARRVAGRAARGDRRLGGVPRRCGSRSHAGRVRAAAPHRGAGVAGASALAAPGHRSSSSCAAGVAAVAAALAAEVPGAEVYAAELDPGRGRGRPPQPRVASRGVRGRSLRRAAGRPARAGSTS